ncbi:MAG: hypothetical protein ABSA90_04205 [Xanthobacteraceae bacterium]|jgi:hypothetical protein
MTTRPTRPTRRAILAGAAAVPIAALASVAPSSAEALEPAASPISDPVFAAIEKHRRLEARYRAAVNELGELEEGLPKEITRAPHVALYPELDSKATCEKVADGGIVIQLKKGVPTGKMHWAKSHAEVNENAREIPKEHRAAWLADRHAALKADERALREAQKAAGLARLQKRFSTAGNAAYAAGQALIAMRPATIAGTVALVAYAIECGDDLMPDGDDHWALLDSVAMALSSHVPDEIARSIG